MSNENLFWPDDLTKNLLESPLTILKKAAEELTRATKGILRGEIKRDSDDGPDDDWIRYEFYIVADAMNYRHEVFSTGFNPVLLYPVTMYGLGISQELKDDSEMELAVKQILRAPAVISAAKALISQSQQL